MRSRSNRHVDADEGDVRGLDRDVVPRKICPIGDDSAAPRRRILGGLPEQAQAELDLLVPARLGVERFGSNEHVREYAPAGRFDERVLTPFEAHQAKVEADALRIVERADQLLL